MRFIIFLLICSIITEVVGQNKPTYYDYFDYESSEFASRYAKSLLSDENILSKNLKEVKVFSAGGTLNFHVKLDKRGQIIELLEYYSNSLKLVRTKKFNDNRLMSETEFVPDGSKEHVKYFYDKMGRIISKSLYESSNKSKTEITSNYNTQGHLISRQYNLSSGFRKEEFYYDGDSVTWKITLRKNRHSKSVMKRLRKPGYELITTYWLDTLLDAPFKQRIKKPSGREFLTRWDNKGNIIEQSEFDYDSIQNKSVRVIAKYEYNDKNLLVKLHSYYNTNLLSGEYSSENVYNDRGQLILETRKNFKSGNLIKNEFDYDQYGNVILINNSKFFRYTFDKNGNWILKESLMKEAPRDAWIVESRRDIFYYK